MEHVAAKTLKLNVIGVANVITERAIPLTIYAKNRALGGFILIDDVLHRGPAKAIAYVDTNYSHWKKVIGGVPKTQALYRKVADNTNAWDFHKNF